MCPFFMLFHASVHAVPRVSCSCCFMYQLPGTFESTHSEYQGEHEPHFWLWFLECFLLFHIYTSPLPHIWFTANILQISVFAPSVQGSRFRSPLSYSQRSAFSLPPPPFLSYFISQVNSCVFVYPKSAPCPHQSFVNSPEVLTTGSMDPGMAQGLINTCGVKE